MTQNRSATYQRVWFITGSSAGVGRALTDAVLASGEQAVVTARMPERIRDLIERYPAQALVLELDVTRPDQVRQAVHGAIDRFGHIDVLVDNEGLSAALAEELAPLGIKVITMEPPSSNGHSPGDSAAAAESIIAAVDADPAEIRNREQKREVR
jgi:NADP-dependent 3-hydroxy acid dehydrogenase YdfG